MQTLSAHKDDIANIVTGQAVFGDSGVEILYGCDPAARADIVKADVEKLSTAGYRAKIVGRNRLVSVDLTNVGTSLNARYVK